MTSSLRPIPSTREKRPRRRRGGLMVIAALVCLLIVTSIVGSMLHGALRARRQLLVERDRRQAELLLDAGVSRAVSLLAAQPTFRGDVWKLPAESIVGQGQGRVTTTISQNADTDAWQLRVVAEYPLDRDFPIRRSNVYPLSSTMTQPEE